MMKKRTIRIIAVLIMVFVIFAMSGCSAKKVSSDVWTTIYPVYSIAKEIVGDKYRVHKILDDGVEPHSFEPSASDVAKISSSKAIFYLGNIDEWANKIEANVKYKVSEGISIKEDDPHVWTSPVNAIKIAQNISNTMKKVDPQNKDYYEKNYLKFKNDMINLHKKFVNLSKKAKRKSFLVSHPAFYYLAKDYGFIQYSITGVNEEEEPSASKVKEILNIVKKENIRFVLHDPLENPNIVEPIAREANLSIVDVYGMGITSPEISAKESFYSLMLKNYNAFEKVLMD